MLDSTFDDIPEFSRPAEPFVHRHRYAIAILLVFIGLLLALNAGYQIGVLANDAELADQVTALEAQTLFLQNENRGLHSVLQEADTARAVLLARVAECAAP